MSLSGSKSKSSTTENSSSNSTSTGTQTKNPWSEVVPYLTGDNGILAKASQLYGQNGTATPAMTQAFGDLVKAGQGNASVASTLAAGQTRPGDITFQAANSAPTVGATQVQASTVDPKGAFGALGSIDPTSAFKDLLTGDVSNSYIADALKANEAGAKATYANLLGDASDNLTRTVLPAIRSGANLSGGYGGSRQGIAEGVAIGDTNKQLTRSADSLAANLAQTNANALSTAYEAAQGRKADAAAGLGGIATNVATGNADRAQSAATGNADRSLVAQTTNAKNAMDTSQFNVGALNDLAKFNTNKNLAVNDQRLNEAKTAADLTGQSYDQILTGLTGASNYDASQLGSFADLLTQLAGLGGTINTNETTNETSTGTSKTKGSKLGLTGSVSGSVKSGLKGLTFGGL
jgi:hypothetical protein